MAIRYPRADLSQFVPSRRQAKGGGPGTPAPNAVEATGAGGKPYVEPEYNPNGNYNMTLDQANAFIAQNGGTLIPGPNGMYDVNLSDTSNSVEEALKTGSNYSLEAEGLVPETPVLVPYEGPTAVPLTQGEREAIKVARGLITGQSGNYSDVLHGDQDMSLFNQAVVIPAYQDLQTTVIPTIGNQMSGGAYGASPFSGAYDQAVADATVATSRDISEKRLTYQQMSIDNMMKAIQLLPSLTAITGLRREVATQNLNRKIQVHFQNQGLTQQMFANEVAAANMSLSILNQATALEMYADEVARQEDLVDQQNQSALYSTIGQIGGAVIGGATAGPLGAIFGSQIGGAAGSLAGGTPVAANAGVGNAINTAALLMMLGGGGGGGSTTGGGTPTGSIYDTPDFYSPDLSLGAPKADLAALTDPSGSEFSPDTLLLW